MPSRPLEIVMLGLSITSSWGNGHATTYRSLARGLWRLGHKVTFLERDMPWYAQNRDMPGCSFCRVELYSSIDELRSRYTEMISNADAVIVGSYIPQGLDVGAWVTEKARGTTAFYDIDTPVTISKLRRMDFEYISPELVSRYDLYLSFTGGPLLSEIENEFNARSARPLYCSVDPEIYFAQNNKRTFEIGYIGTYTADRQTLIEQFMIEPARQMPKRRFILAGPMYPDDIVWPANIDRTAHLAPDHHCWFYNAQRFTLNLTRADMVKAGFSPSVRLFEAAACGTVIISDYWAGIETVLEPGREIFVVHSKDDILEYLRHMDPQVVECMRNRAMGRVLGEHTSLHRARQLIQYLKQA
jgi:spore maturation protein CgeB